MAFWPFDLGYSMKKQMNTCIRHTVWEKLQEEMKNIVTAIIWQQLCHPSKWELCSEVWHLSSDDLCFSVSGWRHFLWQLGCDGCVSITAAFLGLGPEVTEVTHTHINFYLCEDLQTKSHLWHLPDHLAAHYQALDERPGGDKRPDHLHLHVPRDVSKWPQRLLLLTNTFEEVLWQADLWNRGDSEDGSVYLPN